MKALLPYDAISPDSDELKFEKGDIFAVCNELADGWLWATNQRTGESGTVYSDLLVDLHVSCLPSYAHSELPSYCEYNATHIVQTHPGYHGDVTI